MKSPRELLLNRYRDEVPRLDRISESLARYANGETGRDTPAPATSSSPSASLPPSMRRSPGAAWRWYWRGLAAVWGFILVIHLLGAFLDPAGGERSPQYDPIQLAGQEKELWHQQWAWRQKMIGAEKATGPRGPNPRHSPGPRSALPFRLRQHALA